MQKPCADTDKPTHVKLQFQRSEFPLDILRAAIRHGKHIHVKESARLNKGLQDNVVWIVGNFVTATDENILPVLRPFMVLHLIKVPVHPFVDLTHVT